MMMAFNQLPKISERDKVFTKDRWFVTEIGLEPSYTSGSYSLNFSRIKQDWFKHAAKEFIMLQALTKTYSTCASYLTALSHFSAFLSKHDNDSTPDIINRSLIIKFIAYLITKGLGVVSRNMALIHLRTFHNICLQYNLLPWPENALIYASDFVVIPSIQPKYIPSSVIRKIKARLHKLLDYQQSIVIILLETGRRIGEVCSLPYDCLTQDSQGDWYMKVNEKKIRKTRMIPISPHCVTAIKEQQKRVLKKNSDPTYLFPPRKPRYTVSPHIGSKGINIALKRFVEKHNITDDNGKLWVIHTHQFRHTVGTTMINSGVPQILVQQYLGHVSPEMTARYAHIHNDTMKKAFIDYQKQVNINGEQHILEAQWLKESIVSQALPNGLCALPLTQKRCPHANACLTCSNFRTNRTYLPQHKSQLKKTCDIIKEAEEKGWQRIIDTNTEIAGNLTKIIAKLEEVSND